MAVHTIELWEVLQLNRDPGITDPSAQGAGKAIALDTYPIFDESHRRTLNEKILERYWNREIGFRTVPEFRLAMKRRLNEIMPFYNKLYLSELMLAERDALSTIDINTHRTDVASQNSTQDSESDSTSSTEAKSKALQSDTPQNQLPDGWLENADYASGGNASASVSDGTAKSTGNTTGTAATNAVGDSSTTGFQGSIADLVGKYRAQIINVDLAIVDALESAYLFMAVYSDAEYLPEYRFPSEGRVSFATFRPLGPPPAQIPDLAEIYESELDNN